MAGLFGGGGGQQAMPPPPTPPAPVVMPQPDKEQQKRSALRDLAARRSRATTRANTILGNDEYLGDS